MLGLRLTAPGGDRLDLLDQLVAVGGARLRAGDQVEDQQREDVAPPQLAAEHVRRPAPRAPGPRLGGTRGLARGGTGGCGLARRPGSGLVRVGARDAQRHSRLERGPSLGGNQSGRPDRRPARTGRGVHSLRGGALKGAWARAPALARRRVCRRRGRGCDDRRGESGLGVRSARDRRPRGRARAPHLPRDHSTEPLAHAPLLAARHDGHALLAVSPWRRRRARWTAATASARRCSRSPLLPRRSAAAGQLCAAVTGYRRWLVRVRAANGGRKPAARVISVSSS